MASLSEDSEDKGFLTKGLAAYKEEQFLQAVFWYTQHSKYVYGGKSFAKLNFAKKKISEYPYFYPFLKTGQEDGRIAKDTGYKEVHKLFLEALEEGEDFPPETVEADINGLLVKEEVEEMFIQATCKITGTDEEGYGVLANLNDKRGILVDSRCISRQQDCKDAKVIYESIDDDDGGREISLDSEALFEVDSQTGLTFVGLDGECKLDSGDYVKKLFLDYSSNNLSDKGKKKGKQNICYTYFYVDGPKCIVSYEIQSFNDENGIFKVKNPPSEPGLPMYCGEQLLGINTAKGLVSIRAALGRKVGDKVTANWTDGNPYEAELLEKLDGGWRVSWTKFFEEGEIKNSDIVT